MHQISIEEIVEQLKNRKAPGLDGIAAEMLKADKNTTAGNLLKLLRCIGSNEQLPDDWKTDGVIRIPKKGDLMICDSWTSITLNSIVLKDFSLVILNRIHAALDNILRNEQTGFRQSRGCADQIFLLRHIIQQYVEFKQLWYWHLYTLKKLSIVCTEQQSGKSYVTMVCQKNMYI